MVDTNCDPEVVDYAIASNDDAVRSIKLVVELMADAIVEAKGGLLSVARQVEEEPDVTMADVIVNVEEQIAENERRRRQKNEERRAQQAQRRPYNRDAKRGGRSFARKEKEEVATEGTVAEPVAEANEVKTEAEAGE